MPRTRVTRRNQKRKSYKGGYTAHAEPATYSDSQSYMLKTVGDEPTQYNNTFQQTDTNNSGFPAESNAIRGLQGQVAGKKYRQRKMKKSKGGFFGSTINKAIVPLTLFGLQRVFKKKFNNRTFKNKTKSNRTFKNNK